MKKSNFILFFVALLVSCSTPKYTYVFKYIKHNPKPDYQPSLVVIDELNSIPPQNLYVSNVPDFIPTNETQPIHDFDQSPVFEKLYENEDIKQKVDYISKKYEDVLSGKIKLNENKELKKEFKSDISELSVEIQKEVAGNKKVYRELKKSDETPKPVEGFSIAGFILGVISLVVLPIPLGALAIIFSGIAMARYAKNPEAKLRGLAIAGLILGIIGVIVGIVLLASV